MAWPTKFITRRFGGGYKRVSHPKSSSENKSPLDQDAILRWQNECIANCKSSN
ncbi:hypothetical protein NM528_22505 (plasmid) [Shewanella algae]|uniref:hypothetical protein n=1 Tax=Shewanella algae TaxID=38313 RepID=UPI00315D2729